MFSSPGGKRLLAAFLVAPLAAPIAYVLGTLADVTRPDVIAVCHAR